MKIMKMIKNKSLSGFVMVLLAVFGWNGCNEDFTERRFDTDEEYMQIYDYVKSRQDLSVFKAICDYSGFYSTLSTSGAYTVFVPNDTAFVSLFKELKIRSYEEKTPEYWSYYMKYHTIEKKINTNSFEGGLMKDDPTMMGDDYALMRDVTSYTAIKLNNRSTIVENNIDLQNGYLNVIDRVLLPPINTVYDLLVQNGGYTKMLKLFEDNGFKNYLMDTTVTVLVEPDEILEGRLNPDTITNLKDWLAYHIYPGERSFVSNLNGRSVASLYPGDVTTFNLEDGKMYCNMKYPFSSRARYGIDNIALNGILHAMDVPLWIIDHTAGIVRYNFYGRDNDKKGYKKNVFADTLSMGVVKEHTSYKSFHQGEVPPICAFIPSQTGDVCETEIPDVVPGTYTIRMYYYSSVACNLTVYYNDITVNRNIAMNTATGNFEEMTTMQYKDMGSIEVNKRGSVKLRFMAATMGTMLMDMIELRPIL